MGIEGGPVGGVDYPRTYQEFRSWFPDDASCAAYLARLRWPDGFRCPSCDHDRAWQTSTQHWKCVSCGRKTSVTAGTIFHRTRTPLSTWFAAIWLVTSQKNGASAKNLHDMLGLGSYETAWAWLHKMRRAMVRPDRELLTDVVEVDESFVGGRATGRLGASTDKAPVMIAVENVGTEVNRKLRLGRVRLGVADSPGSKQLVDFARTTVEPGSLIRTDGARMFRVLASEGYQTRVHLRLQLTRTRPRHPAGTTPGGLATQTVERRHPPLPRRTRAPAVLPRRVHIPVQSAPINGPRHALLPTPAAKRQYRPTPIERTHQPHVKDINAQRE